MSPSSPARRSPVSRPGARDLIRAPVIDPVAAAVSGRGAHRLTDHQGLSEQFPACRDGVDGLSPKLAAYWEAEQ